MPNDSIAMSEEDILSAFDTLGLATEEQRQTVLFSSLEPKSAVNFEIVLIHNASTQTDDPLLLHA